MVAKSSWDLKPMDEITYDTIKRSVLGTFTVKCKDRTIHQKNALLRYWRNKSHFTVEDNNLLFRGKRVLHSANVGSVVKTTFNTLYGCGARAATSKIKQKYQGVSERKVLKVFEKSVDYNRINPQFKNKSISKPVNASQVNERWQIDLIDMSRETVNVSRKKYRYILSVLDTFSRFVILRGLEKKSSEAVATELEKVFGEHGAPTIVQCDQGTEFRGIVERLLRQHDVKIIRSRAYHPQSQGKCERSHRLVRKKINFLKSKKSGFNWGRDLYKVQRAINEMPKEVLGNLTPLAVFTARDNAEMKQKVKKASSRCNIRLINREIKKGSGGVSIYKIGEDVLLRYPPGKRVPKRRFVLEGRITDRKLCSNLYKVKFQNPKGITERSWINVKDLTSRTREKEKSREKFNAGKAYLKSRLIIPKNVDDKLKELDLFNDETITVRLNPNDAGNCQFDAAADQLQLFGINRSGRQLRLEAVEHILANVDAYNDFMAEASDSYVQNMRRVSQYGDHITLLALAREYNVQFLVISSSGLAHCTVVSNDSKFDCQRITLTLGHFPENHYVSLNVEPNTVDLIKYAMDEENWIDDGQNIQQTEGTRNEANVIEQERNTEVEEAEEESREDIEAKDAKQDRGRDKESEPEIIGHVESEEESRGDIEATGTKQDRGRDVDDERESIGDLEPEEESSGDIEASDAKQDRGRDIDDDTESIADVESEEESRGDIEAIGAKQDKGRDIDDESESIGDVDTEEESRGDIEAADAKQDRCRDIDGETESISNIESEAESRGDIEATDAKQDRGRDVDYEKESIGDVESVEESRGNIEATDAKQGRGRDINDETESIGDVESEEESRGDIEATDAKQDSDKDKDDETESIGEVESEEGSRGDREATDAKQDSDKDMDDETESIGDVESEEESRGDMEATDAKQVRGKDIHNEMESIGDVESEEESRGDIDATDAKQDRGRDIDDEMESIGDVESDEESRGDIEATDAKQDRGRDIDDETESIGDVKSEEERRGDIEAIGAKQDRGRDIDDESESIGNVDTEEKSSGDIEATDAKQDRCRDIDGETESILKLESEAESRGDIEATGAKQDRARNIDDETGRIGDVEPKEESRGDIEATDAKQDRGRDIDDETASIGNIESEEESRKDKEESKENESVDHVLEQSFVIQNRDATGIEKNTQGVPTEAEPLNSTNAKNLESLNRQIQQMRNRSMADQALIEQRIVTTDLPPEIWTIIINMCLANDPSIRFTLRYVCRTFRHIVDQTPLPQIYIAPEVLLRVPAPVSVARLIMRAGRQSGLANELRRLVNNPRWYHAWLHLRELDHRWFCIVYIWWRRR